MKGKVKIIKNLTSLAFGHFLVFTAFDSLSNLQSTVNLKDGMGIISQSVIYACFTISSFFLPTYLIKKFGCKKTLLLSVFSVLPYVAANAFPYWSTLIPSAILSGIAFGPLWAARSTYVNEIAFQYSTFTTSSISVINAWFFGIYSFFHENAEIWGNVLSYNILKETTNKTLEEHHFVKCGAEFCGVSTENTNPNLERPPDEKWFTLVFIYCCFVVLAGIVILLVMDPLETEDHRSNSEETRLSANLLIATLKHMRNQDQLLLIPLSFYCGLADGFYNSDFTKSYVACAWGISQVGYVTICYGVVCAIMDCSLGFMVKYLSRMPVFLLAASSHFAMILTLLLWRPDTNNFSLYFVLSGVYGIGASVWWSQIIALYGVIFKDNEEPAFSNFYFWSSLGFSVAYAYSDSLCTHVKIYILLALLFVAITCYVCVEIRFICKYKHHQIPKEQVNDDLELH